MEVGNTNISTTKSSRKKQPSKSIDKTTGSKPATSYGVDQTNNGKLKQSSGADFGL